MDYRTLVADKQVQGSIRNWVNHDRVPPTVVVQEAEQWLWRRLRVRQMLATATGTMSISSDTIALPTGFVGIKLLWITGTNKAKLILKTEQEVELAFEYDSAGARQNNKPRIYYVSASAIQMDQTADAAYPYRMLHYKQLDALSESNPTNFLTDRAPTLLRAACMGMANDFLKDDKEKTYWLAKAQGEINELHREDDMARSQIETQAYVA